MKKKKLNIKKLQIAKLDSIKSIKGGGEMDSVLLCTEGDPMSRNGPCSMLGCGF